LTTTAIELEHLSFAYEGRRDVLSDVSLRLNQGERLGLIGPNGGGKTTLVKIILGLLSGYRGSVSVFGMNPKQARFKGLVGYVPQRCLAELSFPFSVRQVVSMPVKLGHAVKRKSTDIAEVDELLDLVGINDIAHRPVGSISGGQLQRALIARALAGGPKLLVLDEPTVGIDLAGQQSFSNLLETVHDRFHLSLLIVSHDIRAIASTCDKVACLRRMLHFHDSPSGLTPQVLADVFRHDVAAAFGEIHIDAHRAEDCPLKNNGEGDSHAGV